MSVQYDKVHMMPAYTRMCDSRFSGVCKRPTVPDSPVKTGGFKRTLDVFMPQEAISGYTNFCHYVIASQHHNYHSSDTCAQFIALVMS